MITLISNVVGSPGGEPCGKTCLEDRDNQWLGVTLSRQPGENGSILVGFWNWSTDHIMKSVILGVTCTHLVYYFFVLFRLVGIYGKIYFI